MRSGRAFITFAIGASFRRCFPTIPYELPNSSRVVVITGASAGVGRAAAHAFANEGARIGLIARGRAGLDGAKREVERRGGQALVLPTDVADAAALEAAAIEVEATFGPIDVWVNDAMASVFSPIKE